MGHQIAVSNTDDGLLYVFYLENGSLSAQVQSQPFGSLGLTSYDTSAITAPAGEDQTDIFFICCIEDMLLAAIDSSLGVVIWYSFYEAPNWLAFQPLSAPAGVAAPGVGQSPLLPLLDLAAAWTPGDAGVAVVAYTGDPTTPSPLYVSFVPIDGSAPSAWAQILSLQTGWGSPGLQANGGSLIALATAQQVNVMAVGLSLGLPSPGPSVQLYTSPDLVTWTAATAPLMGPATGVGVNSIILTAGNPNGQLQTVICQTPGPPSTYPGLPIVLFDNSAAGDGSSWASWGQPFDVSWVSNTSVATAVSGVPQVPISGVGAAAPTLQVPFIAQDGLPYLLYQDSTGAWGLFGGALPNALNGGAFSQSIVDVAAGNGWLLAYRRPTKRLEPPFYTVPCTMVFYLVQNIQSQTLVSNAIYCGLQYLDGSWGFAAAPIDTW